MNLVSAAEPYALPLLLGPLCVSVAAVLVAAFRQSPGWQESAERAKTAVLRLENESAARRQAAEAPVPEPRGSSAADAKSPSPPDALRQDALADVVYIRELLVSLLAKARALEEPFRPALEGFDATLVGLRETSSQGEMQRLLFAFIESLPALVRNLLTRCDLDLNPGQGDRAVEEMLGRMLAYPELRLISPARGAAFDPVLHTRLGVTPGSPEQRGLVGQVRCRGLRDRDGKVLLRAEILEYD